MNALHFAKIESLALSIIVKVENSAPVEDSRVELKRDWIDPIKAARRLAGHANAARGSDILWIVGLDEAGGLPGANPMELAVWWDRVQACFDGVSPSLTDLNIHRDGKTFCVLSFSTLRAPYVVKNPNFGSSSAGPISFEVPWREGTRVRSATRNDLLQILAPAALLPDIEPMGGGGYTTVTTDRFGTEATGVRLSFSAWVYLTPRGDSPTVIPFHRCRCVVESLDRANRIEEFEMAINKPIQFTGIGKVRTESVTMERTASELVANGPGKCEITALVEFVSLPGWLADEPLRITIVLAIVDAHVPVVIELIATPTDPFIKSQYRWIIRRSD